MSCPENQPRKEKTNPTAVGIAASCTKVSEKGKRATG